MTISAGLIKALSEFQSQMPVIHKDSAGFNYRYASLDNVVKIIIPIMQKVGLVYCQPVGGDGVNVSVTTIIMSTDGGSIRSTISVPIASGKASKMSEIQGAGSVITYLRRYSLSSMLGLVTDDDTDGAPIAEGAQRAVPAGETAQDKLKTLVMTLDNARQIGLDICARYNVVKFADMRDVDAIIELNNLLKEIK